jgi:hypothetical protein
MYKRLLVTEKEAILLEQILINYLKTKPIESINVHILIKHICGVQAQSLANEDIVCGK